jgi:hypothetical protein
MSSAPDSQPPAFARRHRAWPVFALMGAIALVVGFFIYRSSREPEPLRVLVAVDLNGYWWEGSRPAAALADKLAERLSEIGFEPVKGDDLDVMKALDKARSPEEAARKVRAAFVITAVLRPQIIEHPVQGGYFEARVDAPINVRHVGDPSGSEGRLLTWSGAKDKGEALLVLASSLADMAFDEALPRLTEHPTIQAIFKGNNVKLADRVHAAKEYLGHRDRLLGEAKKAYEDLGKARAEADRGAKVTYHSTMFADDSIGGVGEKGVLVRTADITPFVTVRRMELAWITRLETLEWRTPTGEKRPLWSGYNIFSYPSVAPEGAPAIFVEDLFGWAKTLTVVEADGKSRRIRLDSEHRFVDPKMAPGGKAAALYDRPCQDCPGNLLIVATDDGRTLFEEPHEEGRFGGFTWVDATHLAFVYRPLPPEPAKGDRGGDEAEGGEAGEADPAPAPKSLPQALWIVDLGANPPAAAPIFEAADSIILQSPDASRAGGRLALEVYGDGYARLGIFNLADKKLSTFDLGNGIGTPTFSPDGKTIACVSNDDIALFDVEKAEARTLTDNPWVERYPVFSPDGARVYFESLGKDPNYPRRRVALIASAAVADAGAPSPATPMRP